MGNQKWVWYLPFTLFLTATIIGVYQFRKKTKLEEKIECFRDCKKQLPDADKATLIQCLSDCD